MIRVTHVVWRANFGGIERLVLDLTAEQAKDAEVDVSVLFGKGEGEFMGAFEKVGVRLQSANLNSGYDFSPRKLRYARSVLAAADLIHAHTFVAPLALSMICSRRPVVFTEHGNFGSGRRQTMSDAVKRPLVRMFMKRCVDHLTFNSNHTGRLWQERMGLARVSRSVVPNGIAFNGSKDSGPHPARDLVAWAQNSFVVGTSARFASVKRIDLLIQAFARFQSNRDAKLLLVGDGPLRQEFEKLAAKLNIMDRTLFSGFRADVRECQAAMDVCVFPSQSESFGLVAVETLALGKPTIVLRDGGGLIDIVGPVSPADVVDNERSLDQRLAYYYENRAALKSGADQRRNQARSYDIRFTAAKFKEIYRSVTVPNHEHKG